MRYAGFSRGCAAAGLLGLSTLLSCGGAAQAGPLADREPARGGLKPAEVGRSLIGEWDGQIQVHSSDGTLSTAPASMSARMGSDRKSVEIYYEGFAFGKPVDGAMVFRFDPESTQTNLHDQAVNLRATCKPDPGESSEDSSYQVSCSRGKALGQFRIIFTRDDPRSWSISYQSREGRGEWSDMLTLQMDRLGAGQRSAAADGFDHSPLLSDLLSDSAVASVDGDD